MDFTGVTQITKSTVVADFGQARQLCHRIIFCNIQARRLCWLPYPCGGPANYVRKVRVIFCVSAYLDTLFKSPQKLDIFNGHRILSLVQETNMTSLNWSIVFHSQQNADFSKEFDVGQIVFWWLLQWLE